MRKVLGWARSLAVVVAVLCSIAILTQRPARAIILNNGMIVVHNNTGHPLKFELSFLEGTPMVKVEIPKGGTYYTQTCCFAAGSEYHIYAQPIAVNTAHTSWQKIRPHLCNRNGIPYGYAELSIYVVHHRSWTETAASELNTHGCYEGAL